MKPTQTGIAVALALVVIIIMFIFPGLSPFRGTGAASVSESTDTSTNQNATSTTSMTTNPDQLQVIDTTLGTGPAAVPGDTVTVKYVGSLENGTVFDASANHPQTANGFPFQLGTGQVIPGWEEGIAGMKVGGRRHLVIPAGRAYGHEGRGSLIPPDSTLIFDVELVKISK